MTNLHRSSPVNQTKTDLGIVNESQLPRSGISADLFVTALHYSDLVTPRNSEWNIAVGIRNELYRKLLSNKAMFFEANRLMYDLSESGNRKDAGSKIPSYIFTPAGKAYHATALNRENAVSLYSQAASGRLSGQQWLAAKLAEEQQELKIIPSNAIEPAFLRGMLLYREGRRSEAEPYLRRVIKDGGRRYEAAIAMHLVGHLTRRRNLGEAEMLYRESLKIRPELGDRLGEAQVMHSLANLIRRRNRNEAERLYRESLKIGQELGNRRHESQVMHSLANLIGRQNSDEAEGLFRQSLNLRSEIGDRHGEAQVTHSLANLISRQNPEEAERFYRRSLKIVQELGDRLGEAQVMHSLANLIGKRDLKEAEQLYRESWRIDESLGNLFGVAQTLHSLANLVSRKDSPEAETLLRRSLQIGRDLGIRNHQAQTLRSLGLILEGHSPDEAEVFLKESLEINIETQNKRGETIARRSLENFYRRRGLPTPR